METTQSNSSNPTLHEIVAQSNALTEQLLAVNGELTPELEAELDRIAGQLVQKADSMALVLDRLENEAALWQTRAKKYAAIGKAMTNSYDRLWDFLKATMKAGDMTDLRGDETRFALSRLKRDKVVVEDEKKVPASFFDEVVMKVLNKDRLEAALVAGQAVPGAKLEPDHRLRQYANRGKA